MQAMIGDTAQAKKFRTNTSSHIASQKIKKR
jgi:hypothetical protein